MANTPLGMNAHENEELIQWYLRTSERPDLPGMTDGEISWSAMDIADEIRKGTKEGREHLADLLRIRDSIGKKQQ